MPLNAVSGRLCWTRQSSGAAPVVVGLARTNFPVDAPLADMVLRVEGTQKIDGFFASFRRVVGRRPFNTVGPSSEKKAPHGAANAEMYDFSD